MIDYDPRKNISTNTYCIWELWVLHMVLLRVWDIKWDYDPKNDRSIQNDATFSRPARLFRHLPWEWLMWNIALPSPSIPFAGCIARLGNCQLETCPMDFQMIGIKLWQVSIDWTHVNQVSWIPWNLWCFMMYFMILEATKPFIATAVMRLAVCSGSGCRLCFIFCFSISHSSPPRQVCWRGPCHFRWSPLSKTVHPYPSSHACWNPPYAKAHCWCILSRSACSMMTAACLWKCTGAWRPPCLDEARRVSKVSRITSRSLQPRKWKWNLGIVNRADGDCGWCQTKV